ncbi:probable N-acetyltransferase HLS1-like [Aristolochia californica]|uniref:probable N-acetyltransferase HLS1-like n=1 Tax=Aristolochia californica TaxID=171875 RepID=UPI0035E2CFAD
MAAVDEVEIRSFDKQRDAAMVEALEKRCEVGLRAIVIDTMGDPMCRVRNSPQSKMLVAELEEELVGVVRGSIKIVTMKSSLGGKAKVGFVLGLRVSPLHRRRGIGLRLVQRLEDWFGINSVDYVYMATEKDNKASLRLFLGKLGYVMFRTPAVLVNPVANRPARISAKVEIRKIEVEQAECLYRRFMGSMDLFPHDIDSVLRNKLTLGTWVAYPKGESWIGETSTDEINGWPLPTSWTMLSVWNCGDVFKIKVGKASNVCVISTKLLSLVDRALPCLRLPSVPDFFGSFGIYFVYGMHGEGPRVGLLAKSLCQFVHNLATDQCKDCKAVVAAMGGCDPMKHYIPHWKLLSSREDIWCIKALNHDQEKQSEQGRGTPAEAATRAVFVDPREV